MRHRDRADRDRASACTSTAIATPVSGDLLVGADGLNSVVRAHVLGDGPPRYAGETIFRGIAEAELDPPDVCREVLGAGQRAAFYDLGAGRCYWWATSPVPPGTAIPEAQRSAYLQERFARWPYGLPELFARTPSERILQNDIFDRNPARTWHRRRVVLLGDAAHPTTPNLGQGACLAIEDAVVLARAIARFDDCESAFSYYHRRALAPHRANHAAVALVGQDGTLEGRPAGVDARPRLSSHTALVVRVGDARSVRLRRRRARVS